MSYVKLFADILDSTIWQESKETKLVWITILAKKDRNGVVSASIPGLAKAAGVTLSEAEAALKCLLAPDPYSRSKEFEGRRIEEVDGGWVVLNHEKYRDRESIESRREQDRIRQQRHREKQKVDTVRDEGASPKGEKPTAIKQTEEEWLAGLTTDAAYTHIDVQRERAKMARWCQENGKEPTRRSFIAWLNRIDPPPLSASRGKSSPKPWSSRAPLAQ